VPDLPPPSPSIPPSSVVPKPSTNLLRPRAALPATPPQPRFTPRFEPTPAPSDAPPLPSGPSEMRPLDPKPVARAVRDDPYPPALTLEPGTPGEPVLAPEIGETPKSRLKKPAEGTPERSRRLFSPFLTPSPESRQNRGPGLFSRVFPPKSGNPATADPAISVEARSDPAADAALKRRLEGQIREALGDRARSVEVFVVDRDVTVRAKVDRLWNRRGVRRTIENLPVLAGYRAKVEVGE